MSLTMQEILFQISIVCFIVFAAMVALAVRTFMTKRIGDVLADLSGKKRQEEISDASSTGTIRVVRDRDRSAFWMGRESGGFEDSAGSTNTIVRESKTNHPFTKAPDSSAISATLSAVDNDKMTRLVTGEQASSEINNDRSQTVAGDNEATVTFAEFDYREMTTFVNDEDNLTIEPEKNGIDEDRSLSDFIMICELSFYGSDDVVTIGKGKIRQ